MVHYLGAVFLNVLTRSLAAWVVGCTKEACLPAHVTIVASMSLVFLLGFIVCPFIPTYPELFFIAALLISMHTDACQLTLWRFVTLFPLPLMYTAAYYGYLPIGLLESVIGSVTAYFFLFLFEKIYFFITDQEGLGDGDKELLAFIGSGLGLGWWYALMIASWAGIFAALIYGIYNRGLSRFLRIPFGVFLAFGAIIAFFYMHAHCL